MGACSSNYSEWNTDEKWSSQEWKSDELMEVRTGRLVSEQPPGLFLSLMTMMWTDFSLKSRSFLHRVNDRVRKILDQSSKDAIQDSNKHFLIWGMFMSSTLEASVFKGKNYSEHLRSIKNAGNNLAMKQMCDISEKLIT